MARANPRRRRRRRRSYRRNPVQAAFAPNRKRRRRRSYRRNPARRHSYRRNQPAIQPAMWDLAYATGGFLGTKFLGNMIMPTIGVQGDVPRMAVKLGIAYLGAWGLSNFLGRRWFTPLMLGGSIEVIQDFVKTFVTPYFPQLAAAHEPLGVYYQAAALPTPTDLGAYYGQMGDAWYAGADMQTAY